jgi:hypothetical protein
MARQASGSYTFSQIEGIWIAAGGNKLNAPMAAAIALAESGGNPNATNDNGNGSVDRGLWQINSVHGSQSTYDVTANARAAVQISNNGSSWRPWCTAYSDGLCGTKGGTYLGTGAPFLKFLGNAGTGSAITTGTNTNPQSGSTQYANFPATQDAAWYNWIIPFGLGAAGGAAGGPLSGALGGVPLGGFASTIESGIAGAIGDILKPIGRVLLYSLFVIGGVALMGVGFWMLIKDTDLGDFVDEQSSKANSSGGGSDDEIEDALSQPADANTRGGQGTATQGSELGSGRHTKGSSPDVTGGARRGPASQAGPSSSGGTGRQRGQQVREGRNAKAAKKVKEASEVVEVAA